MRFIGILVDFETVGINEFIQWKSTEREHKGSKSMHCEIPPLAVLRKKNEPIKEKNWDNKGQRIKGRQNVMYQIQGKIISSHYYWMPLGDQVK